MPLSEEQLKRINKQLFPKTPKYDTSRHEMNPEVVKASESWMSPLNRLIWHKAFKARKTKVAIRDGREFVCTYVKHKAYGSDTEMTEYVIVNPAPGSSNSFVPSGEFRLKDVIHPSWVTDK